MVHKIRNTDIEVLTCVILALSLVTLLCDTTWGAENLAVNPSFERSLPGTRLPAEWTQDGKIPLELRYDGGHTGTRYVRMIDRDSKGYLLLESRRVPVRIDGNYTASAWVRTSSTGGPGVYVNFYSGSGQRIVNSYERAKGPTDGWQQVAVSAVAPEQAVMVSVSVYSYTGDVGTYDFDDVALAVDGGLETRAKRPTDSQTKETRVVEIGSRVELFVDSFMIDALTGDARRELHPPQSREVVLTLDRPWEGPFCAYFTVMCVEDGFRIYYRGWPDPAKKDCTCVVESRDGIVFTRPNLEIFEFEGSKQNNIVWMGNGCHNFTPFRDTNPETPEGQRYKALAGTKKEGGLVPFVSSDGYRWKMLQTEPVITKGAFDSQNLAFWDESSGEYVCYFRVFRGDVRDISRSTSRDFLHWSEPVPLDYGDAPIEQLYTNAITPYFRAPHIFLGFPCRFVPARKKIIGVKDNGINDGVLMSSRDGLHFERWLEAFLRPGLDPLRWTDRNNYIAWGLAPTSDAEISLYWTEHYKHPTYRLRRGTVRTDGFVSIHAGMAGGEVLTRPFAFSGRTLVVNYDTSAAGSLRFELCDESGQAYRGFGITESEILFGSEIAHDVKWATSDVSTLSGKPVRLRVYLKDADLYSFRFAK